MVPDKSCGRKTANARVHSNAVSAVLNDVRRIVDMLVEVIRDPTQPAAGTPHGRA
jgi:hypothetical protein